MSTVMATGWMSQKLAEHDPAVAEAIRSEQMRQHEHLELIASENFVSEAVLEATGSVFTNKYAEGYPGKRYYGGCEYADAVETLAIERAKQLFGAEHANVQPHAGSQANMAAYSALINPGDTILGMNLAHGGHLTHGSPVNFSGKVYNVVPYGVSKETETIDYDALEALAVEKKPKLIVAGGSAYAREMDFPRMRAICDKVGALLMVDMAHFAGLVAAGVHPSPVPHADVVTSTTHKTLRGPRSGMILCKAQYAQAVDKVVFPGMQGGPLVHVMAAKAVCFLEALTPEFKEYGRQVVANARALADVLMKEGFHVVSNGTDTHLMVVDVFSQGGLRGKEAETALHCANITISRSTIPFDTNTPFNPSGIRVGSQALTTRGMKEAEMKKVGAYIAEALRNTKDDAALAAVQKNVLALANQFPLYGWRRG